MKRIRLALLLGILGGLFTSACAGVATGQVSLPAGGELFIAGGPAIDMQSPPSFEVSRPANSASYIFEKAEQSLLQSQMQTYDYGGVCARGGH